MGASPSGRLNAVPKEAAFSPPGRVNLRALSGRPGSAHPIGPPETSCYDPHPYEHLLRPPLREDPYDMKTILAVSVLIASVTLVNSSPSVGGATASAVFTGPPLHCQVPCGIYGDKMRIDMLMEDCATIEKAMTTLQAMDAEESPSKNQMVRWVMTKEQHAQSIQDTVAAYWLAQRIKAPKDFIRKSGLDDGINKYYAQLKSMHQITVAAMKCKQTTDKSHVDALRKAANEFSAGYFTAEDLKHLNEHEHSAGK